MVSFLIFRQEPRLSAIFKTLKEMGHSPVFNETKYQEQITYTFSDLDFALTFDSAHNSISLVCVCCLTHQCLGNFSDHFPVAVSQADLLWWWNDKNIKITNKIQEKIAIELTRQRLESIWKQS